MLDFTSNPSTLINEFAAFLNKKQMHSGREEACESGIRDHTALLGKFGGFFAEADCVPQEDASGILKSFSTALNVCSMNDYWIIDSGVTDHMTNKIQNLHDFKKLSIFSKVSVANGKGVFVLGKRKIKILSDHTESVALYVPSFPFQLLSVGKIIHTLRCLVIFSPYNVIFQDLITKRTIGEGFFLNGLYYLPKVFFASKVFQVSSSLVQDQHLWHKRLAHP